MCHCAGGPATVYIDSMHRPAAHRRSAARSLLAGVLLAACAAAAGAQALSADYTLTAPAWVSEPEFSQSQPLAAWRGMRLNSGSSPTGNGLSLEAGEKWFARAGIGRSLDSEMLSFGAGYRFGDGNALSMHVTRQLGQERLGLAMRYDWQRSYLRFGYDQPLRTPGSVDRLRFSAGVRF
jgi:hypothetical protein